MEAAGLAVGVIGIAGLFTSCLDCLERLESYRGFFDDSKALETLFNAEKVSFQRWGRTVGFAEGKLSELHHPTLDDPDIASTAHELLKIIYTIFQQDEGKHLDSPERGESKKGGTKRQKIAWALWGKNRREEQVHLFADLVRKLHELVPLNTGRNDTSDGKDRQSIDVSDEAKNKVDLLQDVKEFLLRREEEQRAMLRRELQSWLLGSYCPNDLYRESVRKRIDGTCGWLLERPQFTEWQLQDAGGSSCNLLWITGAAGFGKTILFARILEYLSETSTTPTAPFFFSSDFESRSDPLVAVRCWISVLMMRDARAFDAVYASWLTEEGKTASSGVLESLFEDVLRSLPGCVLALDGLDECTNPMPLLELICEAASKTKVRVLMTSRGEPEIRHALEEGVPDFVEYRITVDDVRTDTASYSKAIVNERLPNKAEEIKSDITQRMVEQCDGQFLWLRMQAECLRKGLNLKQLQRAISETPTGLDHLYERNWEIVMSLRPRDKQRAIHLLQWATFALRPLTINEITEAVLIEDGVTEMPLDELPDTVDKDYINSEITDLCGSLIELRQKPGEDDAEGLATVHVTHFSVKQYLLSKLSGSANMMHPNKNLLLSYETRENVSLAKKCIQYLSFDGIWESTQQQTSSGLGVEFLNYAAHSWHRHAKFGPIIDQDLGDTILKFFCSTGGNWSAWTRWYDDNENTTVEGMHAKGSPNPLYYSAKLGLENTLNQLLELDDGRINEKGACGRTPLAVSCTLGHLSTVQLLFDAGARIEGDSRYSINPLYEAALHGRTDVVKFLLSKKPSRSVRTRWGWTPLHASANAGHAAIVKLLIEYGLDLNAKNTDKYTALHLASRGGHVEVVKLFLDKVVNLEARTNYQYTALHQAAKKGHVEVVELLSAAGANIETLSHDRWSPLNSAAGAGHLEVVKILLEKGASLETRTVKGWTPLRSAVEKGGFIDLIRLLIEHGASLDSRSKEGWTPLMSASLHGSKEIVKLLIEAGADVEAASAIGWTSLHHAAANGHLETIKILFDKGASLDALSQRLQQPVHCAAKEGHVEIVRFLINHGAKPDATDCDDWTPVHRAVQFNHLETVELLLEQGANIEATTSNGLTPLFLAISGGEYRLIKYLVAKGASIAPSSLKGESAVHLAARRTCFGIFEFCLNTLVDLEMIQTSPEHSSACSTGDRARLEISKQFLNKPVDIPNSKYYLWTPLHFAARHGHFELVEYLVDQGVELEAATNNKWRALHFAARYNHPEILRFLLARGADITSFNQKGNTPLHLAALGGGLEVAQVLIDRGASVEVLNCDRWAAVHLASRYGFVDIVSLLLKNGADIEALTDRNFSSLFLAAQGGHLELFKLLIKEGASVIAPNGSKSAPINITAANGQLEMTQILIGKNADIEFVDGFGETPLLAAAKNDHLDIVKLLLEAGANIEGSKKDERTCLMISKLETAII